MGCSIAEDGLALSQIDEGQPCGPSMNIVIVEHGVIILHRTPCMRRKLTSLVSLSKQDGDE